MSRIGQLTAIGITLLTATGARALDSGQNAGACATDAKAMIRTELLFGLSRRGAPPVTDRQWNAFVAREVTPRFPDGLTIFAGRGQWREKSGAISRENMRMIVIWRVATPEGPENIDAIRAAYKRRFHQSSVMKVEGTSCVSF